MEDIEKEFNDAMLHLARVEAERDRISTAYTDTEKLWRQLQKDLEVANKEHSAARVAFNEAMKKKLDLLKLVT